MLHASVVMFYHFNRGKPNCEESNDGGWDTVLTEATQMACRSGPGEVRMVRAELDGSRADILLLEDSTKDMERMRACLRDASSKSRSPPFGAQPA